MLLAEGTILTSAAPTGFNPSAEVRHETGASCGALKQHKTVLASVCLRCETHSRSVVLSPCGVCLEGLAGHGSGGLVVFPQPTSRPRCPG
ncbi:cytidine deaminase [Actinopolyspora mzabensis]|uniref:Cytidine deaminase n=1 Tax=Actinopolyspora mzabensis TaxID=995066 RepID=A0A1G8Y705_ACTMZ|nr:cytidine deaminase [Actinopolyspora mzabensis]